MLTLSFFFVVLSLSLSLSLSVSLSLCSSRALFASLYIALPFPLSLYISLSPSHFFSFSAFLSFSISLLLSLTLHATHTEFTHLFHPELMPPYNFVKHRSGYLFSLLLRTTLTDFTILLYDLAPLCCAVCRYPPSQHRCLVHISFTSYLLRQSVPSNRAHARIGGADEGRTTPGPERNICALNHPCPQTARRFCLQGSKADTSDCPENRTRAFPNREVSKWRRQHQGERREKEERGGRRGMGKNHWWKA